MVKKVKRIHVDRNLCIGAASCVAVAPGVFELDKDGIAIVKNISAEDEETVRLAAESCPVKAILLYGDYDEQLYP